jgi:hypothetical protein
MAELDGGALAITSTAQTLTDLLGLSNQRYFQSAALRADVNNLGTVWFGKANVSTTANQFGYLNYGEGFSIDISQGFTHTDSLYLISTEASGDKVYVTMIY